MNMRSPHCLFACFLACAVVTSVPRLSAASDTDALTDKARVLYNEAVVAYQKSKWSEARASFLAAWSLKKHWQIAGSLGDCEAQLGLQRDAAEHLAYFLRLSPSKPPSPESKRLYESATSKIGVLVIAVDTPGADVVVDGKFIGKSPLEDPVFVEPGHHTIEVRLGAKRATTETDAPAGSSRKLSLMLANAMPPGEVTSEGPNRSLVIGGASVSAAALGTGIAFTVISNGRSSDAATLRTSLVNSSGPSVCDSATVGSQSSAGKDCRDIVSRRADRDAFGNAAFWSFIGAGAVGAGTLIYALTAPRTKTSSGLQALPVVSSAGGGMLVQGTW
jgi:PEGA domain